MDEEDEKYEIPNPWAVSDASVFLKYNCPECDQKCQNLSEFKDHAIENHEKAKVLFSDIKNEPTELDIKADEPKRKRRKVIKKKVELDLDDHDDHFTDHEFSDIECLQALYQNDKWSCSECGFDQVEEKFDLVDHWLDHHNFKSVEYEVCHYCSSLFNNQKSLVKHFMKHHPNVPTKDSKC